MVRLYLYTKRPAVAMIELIFALVIMGIVMMSAPMLISSAGQSSSTAMQQEGINQAVSRMNIIMSYPWDEQDTDTSYVPILHTTAGDAGLAMVSNQARRVGTPQESQRTYIFSDGNNSNLFASTSLGLDAGETVASIDDIDDFIGDINLTGTSASTDYIDKNINLNTAISYNNDSVNTGNYNQTILSYNPFTAIALGQTSNIKSIVVTLTSTDTANASVLAKNITLRAFSSNIGSYILEERRF